VFEEAFLELFRQDQRMTDRAFEILGPLFIDIDAYVGDEEIRDEDNLDASPL
jgi:hypothetical protein